MALFVGKVFITELGPGWIEHYASFCVGKPPMSAVVMTQNVWNVSGIFCPQVIQRLSGNVTVPTRRPKKFFPFNGIVTVPQI
jgi:hypothetical protein